MKKIMGSRLYKTSPFKDKIHAAMTSPLNKQLVMQLSSYLEDGEVNDNEEYVDDQVIDEELVSDEEDFDETEFDDEFFDEDIDESEDNAQEELEELKSRIVKPKSSKLDKQEIKELLDSNPQTADYSDIAISDMTVTISYPNDVEISALIVPVMDLFSYSVNDAINNLRFVKLYRKQNAMLFNYGNQTTSI